MMSQHLARPVSFKRMLLAAVCAAALVALEAVAQTPHYTVSDLGAFTPRGVNEAGQVAGAAFVEGRQVAVLYDGALHVVNPSGSLGAEAYAVNNHGQVVGWATFCLGFNHEGGCLISRTRAFVFHRGRHTLFDAFGGSDSFGADINDAGLVTGSALTPGPAPGQSGEAQAFAAAAAGGPLDNLGAKMGVANSVATAVNARGQIAGRFIAPDRHTVGFVYDTRDDTYALFPVAGWVADLNDSGQAVGGMGGNDDGSGRAFLYAGGAVQDLGTLPGHRYSRAAAVNDAGQIVGLSSQSSFTRQDERAFVYEGGQMRDLNALIPADTGWVLREAVHVNARGQIVGRGTLGGQTRAFLLTPTAPLVLLTEPDSARAVALDSVTFTRDPFTLQTAHNFSADGRRRLLLFARNVELAPGEGAQQLIVRAVGTDGATHALAVEHLGRVPGFPAFTQLTVRLADAMAAGDFELTLTLRGATSNKANVILSAAAGAP